MQRFTSRIVLNDLAISQHLGLLRDSGQSNACQERSAVTDGAQG
jgi:hypothetical protein